MAIVEEAAKPALEQRLVAIDELAVELVHDDHHDEAGRVLDLGACFGCGRDEGRDEHRARVGESVHFVGSSSAFWSLAAPPRAA
jgi:hypothetical protein